MKIQKVYNKLLKLYGPQGWWPIINNETLICEYHHGAPRNDSERFEICIGAILTQNTSWKNAEKAIRQLDKNRLLEPKKMMECRISWLARCIRSSGYYNQKAERLKSLSRFIIENYKGDFERMAGDPRIRERLLAQKGIGPETADSILLYALNLPHFVVDAYTRRVFSRLGLITGSESYDEIKGMFMSALTKRPHLYNQYHALIVEHAKNNCRKVPVCSGCPLAEICRFNKAYGNI